MADKKISALTAASTPLAGTEVLPIVQSGATVKATVADVTGSGAYPGHFTTVRAYRSGVDQSVQVSTSGGESFIAAVNGANSSEMPLYFQVQNTGLALTSVASVASTGLRVITGNLIIGTSGNGIDFSATPGTGTSELLADYEEGDWTPTVGGSSTYTRQQGYYTKIGRQVTLQCDMIIDAIGTGSTTIVTGAPFTSTSNVFFAGAIGYWSSLNGNYAFVTPLMLNNSIQFNTTLLAASAITDTSAIFTSGSRVIFTLTYFV